MSFDRMHAIDFTHGRCIAEDPRKRILECEAVLYERLSKLQAAILEAKQLAEQALFFDCV